MESVGNSPSLDIPDRSDGLNSFVSPENRTTETKQKLNDLMNTFSAFDHDMKVGTRLRREKDEHKLAMMKEEMGKLEKSLNTEIRRRVEMNKSIQAVGICM
jgi:hypothetical protein